MTSEQGLPHQWSREAVAAWPEEPSIETSNRHIEHPTSTSLQRLRQPHNQAWPETASPARADQQQPGKELNALTEAELPDFNKLPVQERRRLKDCLGLIARQRILDFSQMPSCPAWLLPTNLREPPFNIQQAQAGDVRRQESRELLSRASGSLQNLVCTGNPRVPSQPSLEGNPRVSSQVSLERMLSHSSVESQGQKTPGSTKHLHDLILSLTTPIWAMDPIFCQQRASSL